MKRLCPLQCLQFSCSVLIISIDGKTVAHSKCLNQNSRSNYSPKPWDYSVFSHLGQDCFVLFCFFFIFTSLLIQFPHLHSLTFHLTPSADFYHPGWFGIISNVRVNICEPNNNSKNSKAKVSLLRQLGIPKVIYW